MFQAIAAVFSFATGANAGANAQYQQQRAEYMASLGYSQAKDLTYYNTFASSTKMLAIVGIAGFALLILIIFLTLR